MKFAVSVLDRAWSDADRIFAWIAAHSPEGAIRWNRAFDEALDRLVIEADQHELAPDFVNSDVEIRQLLFKTRRGNIYRLLYTIVGNSVRVLRVRGPGQAPLSFEDVSE